MPHRIRTSIDGPPARVPLVLVGAHGHGLSHLRNVRNLADAGVVDLVGVCDPHQLRGESAALAAGVAHASALDDLLEKFSPEIVVIATPIHTHVALATMALRAGADVLLEKPPTPSLAQFAELSQAAAETGRAVQVGFQSFGAHAVDHVRALVADGHIGEVSGIGAAGAWLRTVDYWSRSAWAGRRALDGADVVDGVVTNPLGHAVATALRIAGSDQSGRLASIETELFRAHNIESDDTSCVRITTNDGITIAAGLTLCASAMNEPYVVVHGTAGHIVLWYKRQVVELSTGSGVTSSTHEVDDLLADLVAHRRDPSRPLLAPLERTAGFTEVVEAVRTAGPPVPIDAQHVTWRGAGGGRHPVITGVDELTDAVAKTLQTFSELGAPWARREDVVRR